MNEFNQRAVLLQHMDMDICMNSTSGGAFPEIARYVLDRNGIVFGVILDDDFVVKHISIENENDLHMLGNSKYVQSDLGDAFILVKENLLIGRLVCFSGTPCQVAGLKSFLSKEYDNLILVDVVCRAVPSPGVWKKYISMQKKSIGDIKSVRFRDKTLGYQFSTMEIKAFDGTVIRGGIETQPWLRMFFSGMIIRPSCTECQFRSSQRQSDITIWDCFNSYKFDRRFDDKKGTTRMLIHTSKGGRIFDEIKNKYLYKEISVEDAIHGVKEMFESPSPNELRAKFFEDYNNLPIDKLIKKYFPIGYKQRLKHGIRLLLNRTGLDIPIRHMIKR